MSSRVFWVAVGAVGGVYAYRKGQRLVADARERGLVGNVAAAAGTVSRLAGAIEVVPVRQVSVDRRLSGVPATAMRFEALPADSVVDLREIRTGTRG